MEINLTVELHNYKPCYSLSVDVYAGCRIKPVKYKCPLLVGFYTLLLFIKAKLSLKAIRTKCLFCKVGIRWTVLIIKLPLYLWKVEFHWCLLNFVLFLSPFKWNLCSIFILFSISDYSVYQLEFGTHTTHGIFLVLFALLFIWCRTHTHTHIPLIFFIFLQIDKIMFHLSLHVRLNKVKPFDRCT